MSCSYRFTSGCITGGNGDSPHTSAINKGVILHTDGEADRGLSCRDDNILRIKEQFLSICSGRYTFGYVVEEDGKVLGRISRSGNSGCSSPIAIALRDKRLREVHQQNRPVVILDSYSTFCRNKSRGCGSKRHLVICHWQSVVDYSSLCRGRCLSGRDCDTTDGGIETLSIGLGNIYLQVCLQSLRNGSGKDYSLTLCIRELVGSQDKGIAVIVFHVDNHRCIRISVSLNQKPRTVLGINFIVVCSFHVEADTGFFGGNGDC